MKRVAGKGSLHATICADDFDLGQEVRNGSSGATKSGKKIWVG